MRVGAGTERRVRLFAWHRRSPAPSSQLTHRSLLIEEKSRAERFFFLYHGRVRATKRLPRDEAEGRSGVASDVEVGVLAAGSYFGEISILTGTPCRATLKALTRCMMLVVDKQLFMDVWCVGVGVGVGRRDAPRR